MRSFPSGLNKLNFSIIFVVCLFSCVSSLNADSILTSSDENGVVPFSDAISEEKLTILYLYDSREGENDQENDGDELYGRPLAWLGLSVDTFDVALAKNVPPENMSRYRGIIAPSGSWDTSPFWTKWLGRQVDRGIKVLIVSTAAVEAPDVENTSGREPLPDEVLNTVYQPLGFNLVSSMTATAAEDIVRIKNVETAMFGFEAPLPEHQHYVKVEKIGKDVESFLTLWWEGLAGTEAELMAVSSGGGYALSEYMFFIDAKQDLRFWRVNPFKFFEKVFKTGDLPRIEPNLINGQRTYFSHVDGDGFNSYSWYRRNRICGDVLLDEVYEHPDYGSLPVTLSVIGAEMDENTTHCLPVTKMFARKLFALPTVEPAAHGYTHPMDWRTKELCWPGIEVSGKEYTYDAVTETTGAMSIASNLAPRGKKATIFLWTGNCNPDEEALRLLREQGYLNMNGGDTRYDSKVPTLTGVAPPSVRVGNEIRVNTGQANDYILTDEWNDYGGFSKLIETFEKSANPLILPLNIYYHFYAGERKKALVALRKNLDWVLASETTPIWTSDYAAMIVASRKARLFALPDNGYGFIQDGSIPTLRFDGESGAKGMFYPDLLRCKGVTGWCHLNNSLYLYLDGSVKQRVFLTRERPEQFALLKSNRPVRNLSWNPETARFSFSSWGPPVGTFSFQGLSSTQTYGVRFIGEDSSSGARLNVISDLTGNLSFSVPMNMRGTINVYPITAADYAWIKFTHFFWISGRFVLLALMLGGLIFIVIRRKDMGEGK